MFEAVHILFLGLDTKERQANDLISHAALGKLIILALLPKVATVHQLSVVELLYV